MKIRLGRMFGYIAIGLLVVPVVVTLGTLGLAHLLDPRCGTPGDSGGCEMGAFALGVASALPGAILGAIIALVRDYRAARR